LAFAAVLLGGGQGCVVGGPKPEDFAELAEVTNPVDQFGVQCLDRIVYCCTKEKSAFCCTSQSKVTGSGDVWTSSLEVIESPVTAPSAVVVT
jgi:hypothetical protein